MECSVPLSADNGSFGLYGSPSRPLPSPRARFAPVYPVRCVSLRELAYEG